MPKIYTEVAIYAPIDKIWAALTDFAAYKNWNPFIRDVQGKAALGEQLTVTIHPAGKSAITFKSDITALSPQQQLQWRGDLLMGMFTGIHTFQLNPLSSDSVQFVHSEQFSGILSTPIFHLIKKSTQFGFEQMNAALKQHCEMQL